MTSTLQPNGNGGPYGPNDASKTSSEVSLPRLKNLPGYTTPVFKGKQEQRAKVQADVAAKVRHITVIDNLDQLSDLVLSLGFRPARVGGQRGQLVLLATRHRRHVFPE